VLFFIITPWQIGIILTSNYAFLNYLVLLLGILILDDKFLARLLPIGVRDRVGSEFSDNTATQAGRINGWKAGFRLWAQGFFLTWVLYATAVLLLSMLTRQYLAGWACACTGAVPLRQ